MSLTYLFAARFTLELFILYTRVAYADVSLQIPVLGENPLVTIRYARSVKVTFEPMVFQFRTYPLGHIYGSSLIYASMKMQTYEVTIEFVAEPIT